MKFSLFLFSLMMFTPVAILAEDEYQRGYSSSKTCYRSEYREEYIPGDEDSPGYVTSWKETIEFPCDTNKATITKPTRTVVEEYREVDDNDCSEGTVAGGLLGGGIAAAISRGNGRWWAVPTGIVTGAMIGCDIDGG
jgi:hypothetical protein